MTYLKSRKTRNSDPDQSNGDVAWRTRFITLYDTQCRAYDRHRECLEALDANAIDRVVEILDELVSEHEDEVKQLVN